MNAHSEASDELDLLVARMAALEQRVAALENPSQTIATPRDGLAPIPGRAEPAAPATPDAGNAKNFTGAFSLIGIALLGIAGAYVLRAIYEAGLLPPGVVAGMAAAYAAVWLVAAAYRASRRLAAALFSVTSILILAPMLWEMSIRFQAIPAEGAAALLAAYTVVAIVIGFQPSRSTAFSLAFAGSSIAAVALSIGTHHIAPFLSILLVMGGLCELTPLCRGASFVRVFVALCADFSAWSLIYVYPLPAGEQSVYPPVSNGVTLTALGVLFAIQVASLVFHVVQRAELLGVFRALQVVVTFVLLILGLAWLLPAHGMRAIGLLCLLLAVAAYAAAFGRLRRAAGVRNFHVFALWGCSLFIAAVFLLAPQTAASLILGAMAVAAIALAARLRPQNLEAQGVAFLCIAAFASGLLQYTFHALVGIMPGAPTPPVILVAVLAVFAYALCDEAPGERAFAQILHLIPALLAACGITAFLTQGLVALASTAVPLEVFHLAALRTLALCAMALALAWLGARLGRVQMVRTAYWTLAIATMKLLVEDLRHGHVEFIAISIVLVALTFIGVPRLGRMVRSNQGL